MAAAGAWARGAQAPSNRELSEALTEQRVALWKMAALFGAGLLTNFTVNLVGAFPLGELFFAGGLGWVVLLLVMQRTAPGTLLRSGLLWTFVACQVIAFAGYVVSDLYWGSAVNDMARGWARMVFLGIDVLAVAYLFDVPGRLAVAGFVAFEVGYGMSGVIATLSGNVIFGDYWKFGWATPVTIFVLLLAPRLGFWFCQIACAGLGALNVALDFRSLAAFCFMIFGLMFLQRLPAFLRALTVGICVVAAVVALASGFRPLGGDEDNARAGRSDVERSAMVTAAWQAFERSPWVGNGSWFSKTNVMQEFYAIRYEKSVLSGIGSFEQDNLDNVMSIHSQILVGLAEGGILGGCFFIFYGLMLCWALGSMVFAQSWRWWSHLCAFHLVFRLSDLATSPFSGMHRILIATAVGLILVFWRSNPAPRELDTPKQASAAEFWAHVTPRGTTA